MAVSSAKFETVNDSGRREAESVARQLTGSSGRRPATVKLEGLMFKLVRELTNIVLRHPGVIIAPLDRELSPDAAGKILGVSRPGRRSPCGRSLKRTMSDLHSDEAYPFLRSTTLCSARPTRPTAGRFERRSSWTP
jgi:hypothetical protein